MKKILYVSDGYIFGGIEKLELEFYNNLKNKYDINILVSDSNSFKDYIDYLGNNFFSFDLNRKKLINKIKYNFKLYKFLKNNRYDVIHINSSAFFFSFSVVLISKMLKIKKIVVHSHNTPRINSIKRILIILLNPIYRKMIDICISCSYEASKSLFNSSQNVIVLNNGIDVGKYKFNEKNRNVYRKQLNLDNKKVYGNISRFDKEKNHDLLIDIFYEIQKKDKNSVLLLIGDGNEKDNIFNKVKKLNISDKVIFLGFKKDAYNYLNAMDIFLFPTKGEGFGLVLIEAQTNGLITYSSTGVPMTTKITNSIRYFNINDDINIIVKRIINEKINIKNRYNAYKKIENSDYDIKNICNKLDIIYKK